MPTGVPLTPAERLCRRIVQDIVALAKLADDGAEAREKLAKLRDAFRDEPVVGPAKRGRKPRMADDLAAARAKARARTADREAG